MNDLPSTMTSAAMIGFIPSRLAAMKNSTAACRLASVMATALHPWALASFTKASGFKSESIKLNADLQFRAAHSSFTG